MSWAEQIAHFKRLAARETDADHAEYVSRRRDLRDRGDLQAIDRIASDGVIGFFGLGPEFCRRTMGELAELVAPSLQSYASTVAGEYPLSAGTLDVFDAPNFLQLIGSDVSADALSAVAPLLSRIDTRRRDPMLAWCHWHRGFIALALRVPSVWRGIAGLSESALGFRPGEPAGPSVQQLLLYLASAIENRAAAADVLPAWKSTLTLFHALWQAHELNFETLFWLARIVYHDIGGNPLGRVGERVYADVQDLAAAGL
jgi:hypothetical protein